MKKSDLELLYGLAALKALASRRMGLETSIEVVSRGGYGELSKASREALELASKGFWIADALREVSRRAKSKLLKRTLVLISDAFVSQAPEEFVSAAFSSVKEEVAWKEKRFIESVPGLTELFYTLAFMLPILALSGVMLSASLGLAGPLLGIPMIQPSLISKLALLLLIASLAVIVIASWARSR